MKSNLTSIPDPAARRDNQFDERREAKAKSRTSGSMEVPHDRLIAPQFGLGPKRLASEIAPQPAEVRTPTVSAMQHRLDAQQALEALFDSPRQATPQSSSPPVIVRKRRLSFDARADAVAAATPGETASPHLQQDSTARPRGRVFRLDRCGSEPSQQKRDDEPVVREGAETAPPAHRPQQPDRAASEAPAPKLREPPLRADRSTEQPTWSEAERALGVERDDAIERHDPDKAAPPETQTDEGASFDSKKPQVVVTAREMRERVDAMPPLQALAWLLVTPHAELKPLSEDDAEQRIDQLLSRCTAAQLHEIKPASDWIADPLLELAALPFGRFERVAPTQQRLPGNLPPQLGDRGPFEPRKRTVAPVWRIEAISLLGILIMANRRSALARLEAAKVDPLRPAAHLLRLDRSQEGGAQIASGYALALHTCASEFFEWIEPRQADFRARAKRSTQRLTEALAHGIDAWCSRDRRPDEACAHMTAAMLQLGALIDLDHLMRYSAPGAVRQPLAVWSWLAELTHKRDPHGLAALQMLVSAGTYGYDLTLQAGLPSPLAPYVRADEHEAVSVLLQAGINPLVEDANGSNALQVGEAAGASKSVAAIERHLDATLVPALRAAESELRQRIMDLERVAEEMKELDKIFKAAPA